jgi:hypothetical protein
MRLEIVALSGIPEVHRGDDIASLIRDAAKRDQQPLDGSVVLAVAQKIVSKAEGAIVDLREIQPSALAQSWATDWDKDPRLIELILSQSKRIIKMDRGVLIAETHLGYVCANAGVDQSNVKGDDFATVLPKDPDASAARLRKELRRASSVGRLPRILGPPRAETYRHDRGSCRPTGCRSRHLDAEARWMPRSFNAGTRLETSRRHGTLADPQSRTGSLPMSSYRYCSTAGFPRIFSGCF